MKIGFKCLKTNNQRFENQKKIIKSYRPSTHRDDCWETLFGIEIKGNCYFRPIEAIQELQLDSVRFMPQIAPALPVDPESSEPDFAMEHASDSFITCEVMLGITTTESYADFNANDIQYGFEEDHRNRVLRTYIRNTYVYHLNEIFSAVRNEYTDWDKPIPHPINIRDSTMEALSDGHTVAPAVRVAFLHARRGAKTYFFHFGYQTKNSDYPQVWKWVHYNCIFRFRDSFRWKFLLVDAQKIDNLLNFQPNGVFFGLLGRRLVELLLNVSILPGEGLKTQKPH